MCQLHFDDARIGIEERPDEFRLLCVLDAGCVGGQDGLRRIERPSSASRLDRPMPSRRNQRCVLARPSHPPGALLRHGDGIMKADRYMGPSRYGAIGPGVADHRNSVPSVHMRCMMTASLRARATFATFTLPRFASRIAHDLKDDQGP